MSSFKRIVHQKNKTCQTHSLRVVDEGISVVVAVTDVNEILHAVSPLLLAAGSLKTNTNKSSHT